MVPNSFLVRVSIAVNKYCNHGNTYKGKYLIGATLHCRGLGHYQHDRTWQNLGRHDTGEVAENFVSGSAGIR